ncbi:uncharacterized protein [Anoplolepis gracilipes]|uniref:uncharacterized protein n=1 Tax=Anoplolepis gracilipes TaxID=354296 RepID=UPI003B9EDD47
MESVWNYYSVVKKLLLLSGQWPYQRKRDKWVRFTFMTAIMIPLIITQIGKYIQCDRNMQCILKTLPSNLTSFVILVKIFTCHFNSSKIKQLTDQLQNDWKNLEGPEEYEIMKTYAAYARLFTLALCYYFYIGAPSFAVYSLTPKLLDIVLPLNESRPTIMPHECHYFVKDDSEYFYYIFLHVFISILIFMIPVLAHDCMVLAYTQHVCSIFAIAGFRFQNLADNIDIENNNIDKDYLDKEYNEKLASAVCIHWQALQFAELLEKTFSLSFFIQMFLIIVGMSLTLLQMVVQLNNLVEVLRYLGFFFSQLLHIFYFSLQGQRLIDHSLQIHDKIYNCAWYKISVRSQKMVINILRRSLQSNIITAGKIYVFSLKSFMTVLQSSVSYFTVLSSFQ